MKESFSTEEEMSRMAVERLKLLLRPHVPFSPRIAKDTLFRIMLNLKTCKEFEGIMNEEAYHLALLYEFLSEVEKWHESYGSPATSASSDASMHQAQ